MRFFLWDLFLIWRTVHVSHCINIIRIPPLFPIGVYACVRYFNYFCMAIFFSVLLISGLIRQPGFLFFKHNREDLQYKFCIFHNQHSKKIRTLYSQVTEKKFKSWMQMNQTAKNTTLHLCFMQKMTENKTKLPSITNNSGTG